MADLVVLYWRDIPAQLLIGRGRKAIKRPLSERFEKAIDAAAMRSGAHESDAYLAAWRKSAPIKVEGDIQSVANEWLERLESDYPSERLRELVLLGGEEAASAG